MKIINPNKETYHHALIREFSDTSRFMMSGDTKGFVRNRYAWFADFANKFNENASFNAHVAYISFFSDYQVFVSEYSNVEQVTNQYPFLLDVADSIISGHDHELSTKQYFKLSNKYSSFDTIGLVNESDLISEAISFDSDITNNHSYYKAPVLFEVGYKVDKGEFAAATSPPVQASYDMYMWANRYASGTTMTIRDYGFSLALCDPEDDYFGTIMGPWIADALTGANRLIDYKVLPYDMKYKELEGSALSFYPFSFKDEEPWSYRPYIGFLMNYQKNGQDLNERSHGSSIFFPQILFRDVIEPQKARVEAVYADISRFHSSGLSHENDDQSQIIYHISRHQSYDSGIPTSNAGWVGQEMPDSTTIVGIDIETERNRRYSAIVTTHPYMSVRPVHNGQIVDYKFVKDDGGSIESGLSFPDYGPMCLKIKATPAFLASLDIELGKREFNTDIMHTLQVSNPVLNISSTDTSDYGDFGAGGLLPFLQRQEYCTDDLIDGVVGIGNHVSFEISDFPSVSGTEGYTGRAKLSGMGYYVKTHKDSVTEQFVNAYCCNYTQDDAPPATIAAKTMTLSSAYTASLYELFRPMILLPGIRGYVKIISRSEAHRPTTLSDGTVEVIYDIEIPYCPGAFDLRVDATDDYLKSQVVYKDSYISAGSHAMDSKGSIDGYNGRFAPSDDAVFSRAEFFISADYATDTIESDPQSLGGAAIIDLVSRPVNKLIYPAHLAFGYIDPQFLGLTKPRSSVDGFQQFHKYGTFEAKFYPKGSGFDGDMKLAWYVDNRSWRYDDDKYSSYVNRECPSYVISIDASGLEKEIGKEQHKYGGIPDIKRWLYGKALAFCSTAIDNNNESLEDNTDGSINVPTKDSSSDVLMEIWDNAYEIGSSTKAMWRPLTTSFYDTEKAPMTTIVGGLHAAGAKVWLYGFNGEYNLFSVSLGKFDPVAFDEGLTGSEVSLVHEESNLVLVDSDSQTAYHIAYIRQDLSDANNYKLTAYILVYVDADGVSDTLPLATFSLDPYNWEGPLSIQSPYSKVSRNTEFEFNSCKVVNTAIQTRYMDFGDKITSNSDFNRYVVDGKIHIRIRPMKSRTFPQAYSQELGTPDTMQWTGVRVTSAHANTNFPWFTLPSTYDEVFDWSKIGLIEYVRRFGLNYFALQSK